MSSFLVMMAYLLMPNNILAFSDLTSESDSELKGASSHVGDLRVPPASDTSTSLSRFAASRCEADFLGPHVHLSVLGCAV